MNRIYLFFTFLVLTLSLSAQENQNIVRINFSPEMKQTQQGLKSGFHYMSPLSYDKTGLYVLLMPFPQSGGIVIGPKQGYAVCKISPALEMSEVRNLDLTEGDKEKQFEFAIPVKGTDYVFTSFQNQKVKKTFLFAQAIDKKTMELKKDLIKIAEIDYSQYDKYKYSSFAYTLSPDSSRILFSYSLLDKNDQILNMGLAVCNSQLKQEWTNNEGASPDENVVFTYEKYSVNNQGDVFILGRTFETNKKYEKYQVYKKVRKFPWGGYLRLTEKPDYSYKLLSVTNKGRKKTEYDIQLPGLFIRQLSMAPLNNKELVCAGVYSRASTYSVTGSCHFRININTGEIQSTKHEFTKSQLTSSMKEKDAGKLIKDYDKGKEFDRYFYSVEPVVKKGGGYYLLAEQVEKMRKSVRSGNTITIFNAYYYDDMFVISINAAGETEWVQKVDKHTYTALGYNVYGLNKPYLTGDNLYLTYEEMDEKATNMFGIIKRSKTTVAQINGKGEMKFQIISTAENDGVSLLPGFTGNFSANSFFILGTNMFNKFRLAKVDLVK